MSRPMYVPVERWSQPPAGTPAAGEWLKRGLVFASTLADPRSVDAVTQRVSVYADFPPVFATKFGAGRVFGLTSTAYQQTPYTGGVRQTNKKSYVIRANPFGTGGGTFGRLWDKGDGTILETRAWWDGTTITYSQAFDGAVGVWTVPWTTSRVPFVLAVSHDQTLDSNVPIIMVNGVRLPVTTATGASGTRQVVVDPMIVGNRASDQLRNFDGWLADFLIFDSALTEGELRDLSFNPYQAWEPELTPVFLGAGGGAAVLAATLTGSGVVGAALTVPKPLAAGLTGSGTVVADLTEYRIDATYERSSVKLSTSGFTGSGDSAVITIAPRVQLSEVVSGETRWLEPSARVRGVRGKRPTFKFSGYAATAAVGTYHGAPWQSTRKPKFSYDGTTWVDFDVVTVNTSDIEFRHNSNFTGDTVFISRSRQMSVEQCGAWLATLLSTYSSMFGPTLTATAFTPSGATGFSAQTLIGAEFSAQTNELSETIPITPLYTVQINDTSLVKPGGGAKGIAILTGGAHAGEDHGDFVLKAVVEALLGSSAAAISLRRYFKILIYPLLNAPGRAGGGWRGSFTTSGGNDDLNRHFSDASPGIEIVTKPKAAITTDRNGVAPSWSVDFHGTYDNKWATFEDAGVPATATFRSRLATNAGYSIADEGDSHAGFVGEYLRGLGASPAITHEAGEPTPTSDADITAHAAAILLTLDQMAVGPLLGADLTGTATINATLAGGTGLAATLTGSGTLGGTLSTLPAVLASTLNGTGTVTAALTTDLRVAAALAGSATITASLTGGSAVATGAGMRKRRVILRGVEYEVPERDLPALLEAELMAKRKPKTAAVVAPAVQAPKVAEDKPASTPKSTQARSAAAVGANSAPQSTVELQARVEAMQAELEAQQNDMIATAEAIEQKAARLAALKRIAQRRMAEMQDEEDALMALLLR